MSHIRKRVKYDHTPLHKFFGTRPTDKDKGYFYWDFGYNLYQSYPGMKGYPSTRKGGNREDLSPEARKRIAEKVRAYRLGKKLSQETKDKIGKALKGRPRPDMIGNKLSSGQRDNSSFRTPEWRKMLSERLKKRWASGLHKHQRWANA